MYLNLEVTAKLNEVRAEMNSMNSNKGTIIYVLLHYVILGSYKL